MRSLSSIESGIGLGRGEKGVASAEVLIEKKRIVLRTIVERKASRHFMGAPLVEVDKWKPPQRHESDNQQGGAMRPLIYFHDHQIQTALW